MGAAMLTLGVAALWFSQRGVAPATSFDKAHATLPCELGGVSATDRVGEVAVEVAFERLPTDATGS